jgi:hypothetical protein
MNIRERILVEILTDGPAKQAEIQTHLAKCNIAQHIQWLVDMGLLERSGPSDRSLLVRGKRLDSGRWRTFIATGCDESRTIPWPLAGETPRIAGDAPPVTKAMRAVQLN